jgi:hypothetical protein
MSHEGGFVVFKSIGIAVAALALWAGVISPAWADGTLAPPTASVPAGTFGGAAWTQYQGIFEGTTSTGSYRVPYRIIAPASPGNGKRTVLVEPPHAVVGTVALDVSLGRSLVFSRGIAHASVGYSTTDFGDGANLRILDPTVPGVFINGGFADEGGQTDDEIVADFGRALASSQGRALLGRVDRRYLIGESDSSDPVLRLVASGFASGVFDLAIAITASGHDPQAAQLSGAFSGKVVVVNSETEAADTEFVDGGLVSDRYRSYTVAGSPHIVDSLLPDGDLGAMTTPATYDPELRAHFVEADRWIKDGKKPAASTHLLAASDGSLIRDASGNSIAVDTRGKRVPRLPFIELGEAHYVVPTEVLSFPDLLGSIEHVKTREQLGYRSAKAYLRAFDRRLYQYARAFGILRSDVAAMRLRASLCSPNTYTQTYQDDYHAFLFGPPCG